MSSLEGWLDEKQFPYLIQFADLMEGSLDGIVGREVLLDSISANLMREKMNNIILLGPAGTGKTSLMEGYAAIHRQEGVMVLGVDLGVMGGDGDSKFAERISNLAKEVLLLTDLRYQQGITSDIIVFLDEMHLLTMHGHSGEGGGSSAGNAIKPLAARKGIKLIGATTDEEYQKYIKPDQALTRRFETVNVEEPDDFTVIEILQQFAKKSLPPEIYRTISVNTFYEIVQYANQYLPAFAQPAKSLGIMDLAIGYHRSRGRAINHELIRDIMLVKANVDVDFRTDIATVDRILREKVMGQDTAIDLVENRLFVANAGLQDKTKPVANFLFAGSTGVGKTELTKAIAESMFGSSDKMIRFDMSEYSLESDVRLFQRRVSSAIDKTPYSVVLFDEFDKACREIMNLLLGILDDGRLSDEYGRQTTFTNAIVILTTNAAADTFKDAKLHNIGLDEMEKMIRGELGKVFSPEFLGRFDEIVPFGTLEEIHFEKIAQMKLAKLVTQMQLDYNCRLTFDSKVMRYLLFERFDALMDPAAGGGRAMSRRIDREITPLIARAVDSARFHHERITEMTVYVDGIMAADRKDMLKGSSVLAVKFKTASKKDGVLKGNATTVAYTQK